VKEQPAENMPNQTKSKLSTFLNTNQIAQQLNTKHEKINNKAFGL
jgi:hypothetical protein